MRELDISSAFGLFSMPKRFHENFSMTDLTRIISISSLFFLSFFCFQAGIFLCSGHKLKKNGRRTLVFIEFFTGLMLLFDALAYSYRGNTSSAATTWYASAIFLFLCTICHYLSSFVFMSVNSLSNLA